MKLARVRRSTTVTILVLALVCAGVAPASARPWWKKRIDRLAGPTSMGVAVRYGDRTIYERKAGARRIPASNEKLLLSMALLDRIAPEARFPTRVAAAGKPRSGAIFGDLYLIGRGDPAIGNGGRWSKSLPFRPTRIAALARKLDSLGVTRVTGSVVGSTGYFARDHWAPGWKSDFPSEQVALPTALTIEGNTYRGRHIDDPEWRAARALTKRLRARGISVAGRPKSANAPSTLVKIAAVKSRPLRTLLSYMNKVSSNFFAEVLGKRLGVARAGRPGTIAKGAAAVQAWAAARGPDVDAFDGSGLSYSNRVSPRGMTRLMEVAAAESWGGALRRTLAKADQGTLENRLKGVRVRAKTGTLSYVSTLSGWVWLRKRDSWAEFSIMSGGLYKSDAVRREDEIVRTLTRYGR